MKAPLIHVAGLIFNEPLAIIPEKLETILRAIGSRLVVDDQSLDELLRRGSIQTRPILLEDAVMFPSAQVDQPGGSDSKPYRLTPEGIAVIPVRGTLMKRYSYLGAASGFSSYSGLSQAAAVALADPQVKGVLFDVDSPGGTTHGCFELSDTLYQMRGDKPMWAVANDLAASAAYALASAADRVWLTRTAGVGSVGVFALHADQSSMDEQAGIKFTYIFAGEKKIDGNPHEPLAKSARADIQAEVDRENDMFLATVARNRGFAGANVEKITATRAGVFFAQNALPLLADEVGSFDEALEALTKKVSGSSPIKQVTKEPEAEKGEQVMAKNADTTEIKAAAATAKAQDEEAKPPQDDEDDDDQGDGDGDGEEKKPKEDAKGKKAARGGSEKMVEINSTTANSAAKRIAQLCQIAGAPELAVDYIARDYDVDKVMEELSERRVKASAEGNVNSFVPGGGAGPGTGGQASVDAAIEQARVMAANSGGKLTQSQCMERILRSNPQIYEGYLEERGKVAAQVAFTGGGRALNEYVLNHQRRYMANLGLSTAIEDVPVRRAM